MNRKTAIKISGLLLALIVIVALASLLGGLGILNPAYGDADIEPRNYTSLASWASKASTIEQLKDESDLIVKARVMSPPVTKSISHEFPLKDEKGVNIGTKVDVMPFSYTEFEVLQVYFGKDVKKITVKQTGGSINGDPKNRLQLPDDPLYKVGEEYVLFLKDRSGDGGKAPGLELYLTVNPFGRFAINGGGELSSHAVKLDDGAPLPTSLDELERAINKTLKSERMPRAGESGAKCILAPL